MPLDLGADFLEADDASSSKVGMLYAKNPIVGEQYVALRQNGNPGLVLRNQADLKTAVTAYVKRGSPQGQLANGKTVQVFVELLKKKFPNYTYKYLGEFDPTPTQPDFFSWLRKLFGGK